MKNKELPFWSLFRLSIEVEKNGELETIDITYIIERNG